MQQQQELALRSGKLRYAAVVTLKIADEAVKQQQPELVKHEVNDIQGRGQNKPKRSHLPVPSRSHKNVPFKSTSTQPPVGN